jgi:lipopolysaccharide transport system ATP-binding protein
VENQPRKFLGNQDARIIGVRFDKESPCFSADEDFSFSITIRANTDISQLRTSFTIFSADGTPVGGIFGDDRHQMKCSEVSEFRVTLPCPNLAPGRYYCDVGIGRGNPANEHVDYDVVSDTLQFEIFAKVGNDGVVSYWTSGWGRIIFPHLLVEQTA